MKRIYQPIPALIAGMVFLAPLAASAAEVVDLDSFVRAETDTYLRQRESIGAFGTLAHNRDPVDINAQPVVRANRDTLYSYGVFDLSEPVTITLPESDRFQSIRIIDQNHFIVVDTVEPGPYELTQDGVGTRYVHVNVRTLVDPDDPEDVTAAHAQQNRVIVQQTDPGVLDLPDWDLDSLAAVRRAVLGLGPHVADSSRMFGAEDEVDPVRHLLGTAAGWGGGPEHAVIFVNVFPEASGGQTPHELKLVDVPVDGFWSISVYNAEGYFEPNPYGGYSINSVTANPDADGGYTIRFGGDPAQENWLNTPPDWNYILRLYLPRQEVIDGTWVAPEARPVGP